MTASGPSFEIRTPEGEDRERRVCGQCGFIDYVNPKIVAGAVVADDLGRILICRRAIAPRTGFWTLPAGYMEEGESVEAAARREAREEACADIELDALLGVYSIPRISQVQIFFRARLKSEIAPGPESQEVRLCAFEDIPRATLAFPSVHWALDDWMAARGQPAPVPVMRTQNPGDQPY
ncbi:NUDIX hydrolase [Alkalicaulis satelles]|uniref:NUDIX hydrolase n=1 Tax=Alkalicaulis satelles TaxID=2609175 RepID=A0A5M6ZGJ2_9PROT|nr:NUDIX hydrolase [Alkalicaulis satelles]KAA5803872.1 NUDIX hydrolase [Alkalicaulis satelles]